MSHISHACYIFLSPVSCSQKLSLQNPFKSEAPSNKTTPNPIWAALHETIIASLVMSEVSTTGHEQSVLVLLIHILEVPGSNLGPETGYAD
jgi:hypothetical protein